MQPSENEPVHWAEPLYDACAAELVLYGRAMGLGHAEAEDLLHDTFRALLALEAAPKEPRFYLIRSFRNRALNHRRTLWRRLAREFESSRWFERESLEHPDEDRAARALSRLPNEQREVIVLKLWHDLTFEEIAELLGLSPNTAAGRYRYGLQKLRAQLDPPPRPPVVGRSLRRAPYFRIGALGEVALPARPDSWTQGADPD